MVTVIKRPVGHKIAITALDGTAFDYTGDVGIYTGVGHGLVDGDYVFIDSNIDAYNGFRYVDSVSYDVFKIKESENGDYIQFKQAVELQFYISVLNHYWQCVHLPIVYELESDLSPSNISEESYLPNTVASFSNNAGYVQLNLTHALSDPTALTKIELVGGTMEGVYQILTVLQPWSVVIDLAYNASYIFTGSIVVKYYDNYAINVNVYAGFEAGHPWESVKPFELAATLRFLPDADNMVKFSIAEILKGYIETRNKLDLDTLPNNTDFMVSFYIEYFETYDESDGTIISTFTGPGNSDDIIGYAVNAMLEFKNQNSGHMSDYISTDGYPAQWLTQFDRPIIVIGHFFDISFINIFEGDLVVTNFKSIRGIVTETEITTLANPGKGVIRLPLEGDNSYDQYCVQVSTAGLAGSTNPITLQALSAWLTQSTSPSLVDWTTGVSPNITLPGTGSFTPSNSEYLYSSFAFTAGLEYTITINYNRVINSGSSNPRTTTISIMDASFVVLYQNLFSASAGANSHTITFTPNADAVLIGIKHSSGSNVTLTITSATGTVTTPSVDAQVITEQICIDILQECDLIGLNDNYRLTEGRDLRALE